MNSPANPPSGGLFPCSKTSIPHLATVKAIQNVSVLAILLTRSACNVFRFYSSRVRESCRLWLFKVTVSAVAMLVTLSASAQTLNVSGSSASNFSPADYGAIAIYSGSYTANAPLLLLSPEWSLYVDVQSLFNANANVYAQGRVVVDGALNLLSGTFSAPELVLNGSATLTEYSGRYALGELGVTNGATAAFNSGNSIGSLGVSYGATFAVHAPLSCAEIFVESDALLINNSDIVTGTFANNGAAVQNTAGGTITADFLQVLGGTLTVQGGNSFVAALVGQGGAVSNFGETTFGSLWLENAGSTFTAEAPVTLQDLVVADAVFTTKANVTASTISLHDGAVIELVSGTLVADTFNLDGSTVIHSGGKYAVDSVFLAPGASLEVNDGDSIQRNLQTSGSVSLNAPLTLSGTLAVFDAGSVLTTNGHDLETQEFYVGPGAMVDRPDTGTVTAQFLQVYGGTFAVRDGDAFAACLVVGGTVTNVAETIYNTLVVSGSGASYTADAALTTNGMLGGGVRVEDSAAFVAKASINTGGVEVRSEGSLELISGTLTANALFLSGSNALVQSGGRYVVTDASLAERARLTVSPGDSIGRNLSVSGSSTVTLDARLQISGTLAVSGGSSTLTTQGNDIMAERVSFSSGAMVDNAGGGLTANVLTIQGATFTTAGDVTIADEVVVGNDGVIDVAGGVLTAHRLRLSGADTLERRGGSLTIGSISSGGLMLDGGAAITIGSGDSLLGIVSISGDESLLTADIPLDLTSLILSANGKLHLRSFAGLSPIGPIAMSLDGDKRASLLDDYASGLLLISNNPSNIVFQYENSTNKTYVTVAPVPEPSTYALALAGLAWVGYSMRRRKRRFTSGGRRPSTSRA